jgi:glycosyltransferase involved in cell wall biosynthesis
LNRELSVVVPCYNEPPSVLDETLSRLQASLDKVGSLVYEVIVVDDGSNNRQYSVSASNGRVRIIKHKRNLGYGASLLTGIRQAKSDWIGIVDADSTYPLESFPDLIEKTPEYDMVIGKRNWKDIPRMRRFPKWLLNTLAGWLAGVKIPDLNSGMRVFRKELVFDYVRVFPQRFSFSSTLTMIGLTSSYNTCFVDIPYFVRKGESKIHPLKDTVRFFGLVFRLSLYFRPLRFFVPLSSFLLALAVARGARDVMTNNYFGGLTLVLFFMAFQVFFFGLIAEIINKK